MLKFSKEQICIKENEEFFGFFNQKFKIESSKLIDYSIDMC
jgi:hypothetical protein